MYCHKCGAEIDEGAAFCYKCGAKLIVAKQTEAAGQKVHPGNAPVDGSKKKKSMKLPIILGAIVLIIALFLILGSLAERGEQTEKDEEYTASQQSAAVASEAADTVDKPLYNGIPIDAIMEMTAEDVIATFGEPNYSDEYFIEIRSEDGENLVVIADLDSTGCVSDFAGDPEKFVINGQNINHDYDSLIEIFGREPDYEEMSDLLEVQWFYDGYRILLGLDEDGLPGKAQVWKEGTIDYEYNQAELDPDLIGRWRSLSGSAITLNDGGTVSEVFSFWNSLNRTPDSVTWEASNGRLILTAYRNIEYKYAIGEGKSPAKKCQGVI